MKKYKVIAVCSYLLETEIEAESFDDARRIAWDTDGGDFKEIDGSSDWRIDDIQEIYDDSQKK